MGWNLVISFLTFVALVIYAYFTYKIARENYIPLISMAIKQADKSSFKSFLRNHSKVVVEYFGKIKVKTTEGIFEFKTGFYSSEYPLRVAPFMDRTGNFDLKNLVNEQGKTLGEFAKLRKMEQIKFRFYLKYRKFNKGKWKEYPYQQHIYNFKTHASWLDDY